MKFGSRPLLQINQERLLKLIRRFHSTNTVTYCLIDIWNVILCMTTSGIHPSPASVGQGRGHVAGGCCCHACPRVRQRSSKGSSSSVPGALTLSDASVQHIPHVLDRIKIWRQGEPQKSVGIVVIMFIVNQNRQEVKYERFFNLDKTKQCANVRHMLPLTKRQTDRHI